MQTPDDCKLFKGQEVLAFHFHHLRTSPPSLEPCTARLLPTASSAVPPPPTTRPRPQMLLTWRPRLTAVWAQYRAGAAASSLLLPVPGRSTEGAAGPSGRHWSALSPPRPRGAAIGPWRGPAACDSSQRILAAPAIGSTDGVRIVRPARTASRRRRSAAAGGAPRERVTA